MRLLLVLVGGGVGSAGRYLVGVVLVGRYGAAFPWWTLAVNLVGSFLIGLLATLADEVGSLSSQARIFLVAGVLGGFTTFSSLSLEALRLAEQGLPVRAALNMLISMALGPAAALVGVVVGRALTR